MGKRILEVMHFLSKAWRQKKEVILPKFKIEAEKYFGKH